MIRDGVVIFDGKLASLKHFKDDVKEVGNAQEGGLMIETITILKLMTLSKLTLWKKLNVNFV